jgi:hypothetical protein
MKWRIFMMLCISTFIVSFPQNIIGCGPSIDPYDYYTSFFNPDIATNNNLRPFYYTGYNFLYDEVEPVQTTDVLANEWKNYCSNDVTVDDAKSFITQFSQKDISSLYFNVEKNQPLKIPDSVKQNSMTKYFAQQKDLEALGYIIYAKKAEPYVTGDYTNWEPIKRDSATMAKLIQNGQQLYNAAKKEIFKLKYAYQITRLAFYSGNNEDAIKFYDDFIAANKTVSVLQPLSLSLKAGAIYRNGNKKEAAYIFSKVFALADVKKVSNYESFRWAVDSKANRNEYLQLCKTDAEKADMLALFALGSAANETETIAEIAKLDPSNKTLETLTAREINKLEENYFTPVLNKQSGGKLFYYTWVEMPVDSAMQAGQVQVTKLENVLSSISDIDKNSAGLYKIAAAYCALMVKNFSKANRYLAEAKKSTLTTKANDQWMLTNLLLAINESKTMDPKTEEKILPSVKWLREKALNEKQEKIGYDNISRWKVFYRNIMAEAIAKKYHMQGDVYKETLAIGSADKIYSESNYVSLDFLHINTDIKDVQKIYDLMISNKASNFENFLLKNNAITVASVTDFAGTAYLRNYEYKKAVEWLVKSGASKKDTIFKSAFIELLDDREERLTTETKTTSKLLFAQEMMQTQNLANTDKKNEAKYFYKMATGMYNMTYYGHAWELVQYYRSGSDGYYIPANATEFQKQYYGCYAAHDMFKKAMDASTDKNFKAKCLFMMAKCAQKIVHKPQYEEFGSNYDEYDKADKKYFSLFKKNKYFPQFTKEYAGTAFYKEAFSRCSYLRDFIKKK